MIKSKTNAKTWLAQARILRGSGWRDRNNCRRVFAIWLDDDGNAQQLAQERADAAVVAALVPFCVAKARQDPDPGILAKFQVEQSSYSRNDLVRTAGWATLGDGKSPDNALARACSDKLHAMEAADQLITNLAARQPPPLRLGRSSIETSGENKCKRAD